VKSDSNKKIRIYIAGHKGMVGSAIVRLLKKQDRHTIITRTRKELDLTSQKDVNDFFKNEKIDQVYLAAAKVGGILANNNYPADFIYENLIIQSNVIYAANLNGVQNLLFLGSSCIYPKLSEQPILEDSLLTGILEETNEPYAISKIAGIKMCESFNRQYGRNYRSIMPTNLYGENDNFHPKNSHVIPALIRRFHEAKLENRNEVLVWGTGKPRREFMHVDDMASACIYFMNVNQDIYDANTQSMLSHINVGTGVDCTIHELVDTIAKVIGYKGKINFDTSKPDGTPRKLMDITRQKKLGWNASIDLESGIKATYEWFLNNSNSYRSQ
jgi:GDP-L-fucose synthase